MCIFKVLKTQSLLLLVVVAVCAQPTLARGDGVSLDGYQEFEKWI